jgi:hypothetical protein
MNQALTSPSLPSLPSPSLPSPSLPDTPPHQWWCWVLHAGEVQRAACVLCVGAAAGTRCKLVLELLLTGADW